MCGPKLNGFGKIAIVRHLLSSQGVPQNQKVLWKDGNAEEIFGHMIWHCEGFGVKGIWGVVGKVDIVHQL